MPFPSLFGLSHLLKAYGFDNEGINVADKTEITSIPTPFLAQTTDGVFVIVKNIDSTAGTISYDKLGKDSTSSLTDFEALWNGIALQAWPSATACEPLYAKHHTKEVVTKLSSPLMLLGFLVVGTYLFIRNGVYAHVSTVLLMLLDIIGLALSFMLTQKTLGIHTAAADAVCGVIEKGGCDSITAMPEAKLFGVFAWSEVGFGYFGVSLAVLLLFPSMWGALAVTNLCCLPFSFWSVWFQKFKAKRWCTLCLGVQATLWLLFFCFLGGGWISTAFPLRLSTFILIAAYATAVVTVNVTVRALTNISHNETETDSSSAA